MKIDAHTQLCGLIGNPVDHSLSPAIHNAAFEAEGLNFAYVAFRVEDVRGAVTGMRALGLSGLSVTIPHKVALFDRVQDVDTLSRAVGALNTISVRDGQWSGRNTDVAGFLQPLRERNVRLPGCRVSILGAGGSARAVAVGLAGEGAVVTVHARDAQKAQAVASLAGGSVGAFPPEPGSWDLLVNCTPVGMQPKTDASPLPADALRHGLVYDLIYNPGVTRLMRDATAAGCGTIGGLDMLVGQAQEQFEWWTGTRPSAGVMRAAAEQRLSEFNVDENHLV